MAEAELSEHPLVSIIAPVYNVESYLDDFFRSIQQQEYEQFEVIAWDDGSSDHSLARLQELAQQDPRIRVFHADNQGVAAARRAALQEVRGELITFADPDDMLSPRYLSRLVHALREHQADMAICNPLSFYDGTQPVETRTTKLPDEVISREEAARRVSNRFFVDEDHAIRPELWGKIYTRAIINQMTIPQMRTCSDFPAVADAICASTRIARIHDDLYYYRNERADSLQTQVSSSKLDDIWHAHTYALKQFREHAHIDTEHAYRETMGTVFYINGKILSSTQTVPVQEAQKQYDAYRHLAKSAGVHRGLGFKGTLKALLYQGNFKTAYWAFRHFG